MNSMTTPICDFVSEYARSRSLRLHMPGHKGKPLLGFEALDITEIGGADSLYEADGIIKESEVNASALFGCHTLYSTEGSSLCIRAMLYLALLHARETGRAPLVAAGRNAHKSFLSAAALLGFDICWLLPEQPESYLSCPLDASAVEQQLMVQKPAAVYLTSPDYLGNMLDIASIAEVCHRLDVLLLVDNAHGAYLRFLPKTKHPMDLGADLCCDSAHKTLSALTGGAYLHIAQRLQASLGAQAKHALALFGSTSPSYLILQSLDACNRRLNDGYRAELACFAEAVDALKHRLLGHGYVLRGSEPMKLTIAAKAYGYTGVGMADALLERGIVAEFADPDFLVLMLTPELSLDALHRLEEALLSLACRRSIEAPPPAFHLPKRVISPRQAVLSPSETLPAQACLGRVLAIATVGCPPAVPIVACGEEIDSHALDCFRYYGIDSCCVVK